MNATDPPHPTIPFANTCSTVPSAHPVFGTHSAPAFDTQPPKNWSGAFASSPQWGQLHVWPSASVPPGVHTRIGDVPQLVLPTVVETKHADGPEPFHNKLSFVQ